ncbi:hypothetical protein OEA41_007081 [Lepraria neglecta]|uniref:Wax synthase domain-containing protein n=1 Tax=Lepraria neglecta TaxID=209136 RepID=A0AAD9Z957_9LECA|nr:hypothetical protein OEA41_007081 [Lepraria neglecta]
MMNSIPEALMWLTHPLVIAIAQYLIFTLAAGFTSPRSPTRLLAFALLSFCTWLGIYNFPRNIQSTSVLAAILAGAIAGSPLGYLDRVILRAWAYEDRKAIFGPPPKGKEKTDDQRPISGPGVIDDEDTFGSRYSFGSEVSGVVRGIGTSFEIKYIPPFSSSDPGYVPSPAAFIASKFMIIIACHYIVEYTMDWRVAFDKSLFLPSKVPFFARLDDVTLDDVLARLIIGLTTWIYNYAILQVFFGIPAAIAVAFKPSSVGEWRPPFGSIQDAYTMRGFWG